MKFRTFLYNAVLSPDPDGGFLVEFPDVPEALTFGATREEAIASAREALGLALRGILSENRRLPEPGAVEGVAISPDAHDAVKLAVILAFRESGCSKTELARRIGRSETEARRILDPDHGTKLDLLQQALSVLGKTLVISVADAA